MQDVGADVVRNGIIEHDKYRQDEEGVGQFPELAQRRALSYEQRESQKDGGDHQPVGDPDDVARNIARREREDARANAEDSQYRLLAGVQVSAPLLGYLVSGCRGFHSLPSFPRHKPYDLIYFIRR